MQYDIQYDICAIVVSIILTVIYRMRARYMSDTNRIFVSLILVNFIAAIFDIISCSTIRNPMLFPEPINYLVNIIYLFCYNYLLVLFLVYIWKRSKLKRGRAFINIYALISTLIYIFTIGGSPWHHGVFYFSENGYHQGSFMMVLFGMSFLSFAIEITLFIIASRNFNGYQILCSILLIIFMLGSVVVTMVFPNALAGQFAISVILFFVYVTYENPAYYTYLDSQCLNRNAFLEDFDKHRRDRILIFHNPDYDYGEQNVDYQKHEQYKRRIADYFGKNFGKRAYNFQDDKYGIVLNDGELFDAQSVIDGVNRALGSANITINSYILEGLEDYSAREVCNLIRVVNKNCNRHETEDIISSIEDSVRYNNQILMSINRALENNSFEVFYQPIYNVSTGQFDSAEALIRLVDPEFGPIDSEGLIVVAEQNGYIDRIGDLVYEKACKFFAENELDLMGVKYIEVNLSPKQCFRPNLAKVYNKILKKYNLKPENMNLEITETADFARNEVVFENMKEFKEYGFVLSLDDFGSGYSSPNYVIQFPVDCIKIDREILWGSMRKAEAKGILAAIIIMTRNLGKKSVVEGAESKEMVEMLIDLNVDYIQGFYFSKPLSEKEYLEFLKKNYVEE